jgi:trimeric autotransporter adhesin
MSTKTNFKRVALVAVAALGLGVLTSVAPASATDNVNLGDPSTFMISTNATTTGSGVAAGALTQSFSKGWVAKTSTNGTANSNGGFDLRATAPAATGVVLAGAQIAFNLAGPATTATGLSVVVTGGSLSQVRNAAATDSTAVPTISTDGTTAVLVQNATTAGRLIGNATISAAAGTTATIAAYTGTGITGQSTATVGSLIGIWTLTVGAANTAGVYNATNSTIATQIAFTKSTTASGNLTYDNNSRIANGGVAAVWYSLKDAFLSPVTTGQLAATATNSAGVLISGTVATALPYSATTAFTTLAVPADGEGWIIVNQPVTGVAGSSTVTITLDGQVLATKTFNWNGDVASIAVTGNSDTIFKNGSVDSVAGTGGAGYIEYVAKDAAGNAVDLAAAPTISGATGALVGAALSTTAGTTYGSLQDSATGYGYGTLLIPSSTLLNGAGTYKLKVLNSGGTAIYSTEQKVTVSNGGLNSFTATWDKTSYTPGEIAVLTVIGKDFYGNPIADGTPAAGLSLTVAGSAVAGLYAVGTACTAATAFSGGKFTCKFATNTEGAWSYSVDVTTVTPQSATVGSLKITSGGGVSNADVLKAIVSLIASINKQIAALQKALLKK